MRTRRAPQARPDRGGSRRRHAQRVAVVVIVCVALLTVIGGVAFAARSRNDAMRQSQLLKQATKPAETPTVVASPSADASVNAGMVEVPALVGMQADQAQVMLSAAGFVVAVRESTEPTTTQGRPVLAQSPAPRTVVPAGSTVTLTVAKQVTPVRAKAATRPKRIVVCIDPGHQTHANLQPEPIGPGSATKKPAVTGGTTGVSTGIPEYEIALQISMNLKKRLEAAGVVVVMTRTTNDVNVTNIERAKIANDAGVTLFVRIHGDGNPNHSVSGISTLYPASNQWTKGFAGPSKTAAGLVQSAVVKSTGAVDRGTVARADLSGFNWATVPCLLVECGFMSNSVEDKLLASPHYQDKVAQGIADGILSYAGAGR